MKFICDASDTLTWFRLENDAEAARESQIMAHAVEKYFRNEWEKAARTHRPASQRVIEQNIGLNAHIQREMPLFLTLRDGTGNGLVTAMLPPRGVEDAGFRPIVVGAHNADPYPAHGEAIRKLAEHFGLALDRDRCFPYRRG